MSREVRAGSLASLVKTSRGGANNHFYPASASPNFDRAGKLRNRPQDRPAPRLLLRFGIARRTVLWAQESMKLNLCRKQLTVIHLVTALALVCATLSARADSEPPKVVVSSQPIDRSAKLPASFAPMVKKVAPCVVSIYSTRTVRFRHPFLNDPLLRRFFGGGSDSQGGNPGTLKSESLGSGVIVTQDGYILTNGHVIEGADEIKVALADDKTEYIAKVIGSDPQTDIAVIKIEAKGMTPITLSDSDQLEVGDIVLAIGNPFDIGQTVTKGIVSAVSRGGLGIVDYEDFIQTDAPINPGNSGGALVDIEGRLVGINQSIVSGSGGSQGIGFAVPVNLARKVLERLVTKGAMTHGYLGVYIQSLTPELARAFGLEDEKGALIGSVQPNTPAADAGLTEGDIVREFNGKTVTDSRHFRIMVAQTEPKTKVTLKIIRDGKERTLTVVLGTLPSDRALSQNSGSTESGSQEAAAMKGVTLGNLDADARSQYDIPDDITGALVSEVEPGCAAADAGLHAGDVVLEISRKSVKNAEEAMELARKADGPRLLVRVWSKNGDTGVSRYIVIANNGKE